MTAPAFPKSVALARLGVSPEEHERFFRQMLGEVTEPTLPFGLTDVHQDGEDIVEARWMVPQILNDRLRAHARRLGVSLASLCHLALGQVLARNSGQERVVFGTVLFGRMEAGEGGGCSSTPCLCGWIWTTRKRRMRYGRRMRDWPNC